MKGQPNRVLRAQRLQRGWTQDDLATALQDLVEQLREARPVIEGNLVGKWERGIRTPGNYYGPRLCLLFELPPDQLGLRSSPRLLAETRKLQTMLMLNRRRFLHGVVTGGAAMVFAAPGSDAERMSVFGGPVDAPTLEGLEAITVDYSRRYHTAPPVSLLPAVDHHLNHLRGLLLESQRPGLHRGLLQIAGRTAGLAGLLAFRRDNRGDARQRYVLAEQYAREAGDGPGEAFIWTARSLLASSVPGGGLGGDTARALNLLKEAERHAGDSAAVRLFLHARMSDEYALAGRAADSDRNLLEAERWAGRQGQGFFDGAAGLVGYRTSAAIALERPDYAISAIEGLQVDTPAGQQEYSILVMLLGAAYAQRGELDRACALLSGSLASAVQAGLPMRVQRIAGLRKLYLAGDSSALRDLDEQLATLTI
jgi:hypothetical protein